MWEVSSSLDRKTWERKEVPLFFNLKKPQECPVLPPTFVLEALGDLELWTERFLSVNQWTKCLTESFSSKPPC